MLQIFTSSSPDPSIYADRDHQLYKLMSDDLYFGSLPEGLHAEYVQTMGHLIHSRAESDLLPSVEAVEEHFDRHANAIDCMGMLVKALVDTCREYHGERKALEKARKDLERKTDAEKKRLANLEKREAEREKKKAAAAEAKAAAKAAAQDALRNGEDGEKVEAEGVKEKKRRVASKIMAELKDTDPLILRERFVNNQLCVVEDLDPWTLPCPRATCY